jgi:hypothetical protein
LPDPNKTLSFTRQEAIGVKGECELDDYFSRWFEITLVDNILQRLVGFDRVFEDKRDGHRYSVEYKTDHRGHKTGNVFIELEANSKNGKLGWAYTSTAQLLAYYLPQPGLIFITRMGVVKEMVEEWAGRYEIKHVANPTYSSKGVIVPVDIFAHHSIEVLECNSAKGTDSRRTKEKAW